MDNKYLLDATDKCLGIFALLVTMYGLMLLIGDMSL